MVPRPNSAKARRVALLGLGCAILLAGLPGCGGDGGAGQTGADPAFEAGGEPAGNTERPPTPETADGQGGESGAVEPDADSADTKTRKEARRTVRAYIEAIDGRDGQALCSLLADGALDKLKLPKSSPGSCAESLSASIGYRDRRGFPVYKGSKVVEIGRVALDGEAVGSADARVTATLLTEFRDRSEPSIEDDFIYLVRRPNGELGIAKASSNLFRAVGRPDIPPSVISPPG